MPFTSNYHPNPAFQNGIEGFAATVENAVVNLDTSNVIYGPASLLVSCPGEVEGEGCTTPVSVIPAACTGSASCFINGTGNVTVYVYSDNNLIAVQHLNLSQNWTRVILQDLEYTTDAQVKIEIIATQVAPCQFWCSGFQVEDTSPCHPYCDGDRDGCYWESGFYGVSFCLYENPVTATAVQYTSTHQVLVLHVGEAFPVVVVPVHQHTYNTLVYTGAAGPAGAVTDFAVSLIGDSDPAQTYMTWNNQGIVLGSTYQQSWATFVPPRDYLVSNGNLLYKRAAFAALGWEFDSATQNQYAQLTRAYAGIAPLETESVPPVFDNPRAIHSIIIADRINFVTNPSFEVSVANWSPVGSAAIYRDNTVTVGEIAEYDETILTAGTHSMAAVLHADFDGASAVIPNLIPGYTYIASVYLKADHGLNNIVMDIGGSNASVQSTGGTGYNYGSYNAGPYGGFDPTGDLSTNTWFRVWCYFTASGDSETLTLTSAPATDIHYPTHMWVDAVLVEQGEVLKPYFDGSTGINYTWDSKTGTPGLARSYYYSQMAVKQQAVNNVLARHTPLGISYDPPVYSQPPTE